MNINTKKKKLFISIFAMILFAILLYGENLRVKYEHYRSWSIINFKVLYVNSEWWMPRNSKIERQSFSIIKMNKSLLIDILVCEEWKEYKFNAENNKINISDTSSYDIDKAGLSFYNNKLSNENIRHWIRIISLHKNYVIFELKTTHS